MFYFQHINQYAPAMKKLFILSLCFLTFSAIAQKVDSPMYTFSEGIEYKLVAFNNSKTAGEGNVTYIAKKGTAYKAGWFEFTNTTKEDIEVNFENIFIQDSKGNKYFANAVAQAMKMTIGKHLSYKLKAGKTKTYMVEFRPPFPKDEFPTLVVNDKVIELPEPTK